MDGRNGKQALQAGDFVRILEVPGDAEADERIVNGELARIRAEAHGAGFLMEARSVAYASADRNRIVIQYVLTNDSRFRPPM